MYAGNIGFGAWARHEGSRIRDQPVRFKKASRVFVSLTL